MKATVYPADSQGCGYFRMIWPAQQLIAQNYNVNLLLPENRKMRMVMEDNKVVDVDVPQDTDVVVFQRTTHTSVVQAIPIIRAKGIAVVVDIDDDLSAIHPDNPAWLWLHPKNEGKRKTDGTIHYHSWDNIAKACKAATFVTTTSPELLRRYAPHGRGRVLPNYLPDVYYGYSRIDNPIICWPASLPSHPNDPGAVGGALARLVGQGYRFRVIGPPRGVGRAFGLPSDPFGTGLSTHMDWIRSVSLSGIGITPLADTRFNKSKSWLKPLELSALRVPWVASPRAEYMRLHKMGAGRIAAKPQDWYREIKRLCDSMAMRSELSEQSRSIAEGLQIKDHAWKWWEAWSDALEIERNLRKEKKLEYSGQSI